MANYELLYFALNGRTGGIRLFLNYLQIPFIDTTFTREEWSNWKSKTRFGKISILKVIDKGTEIPQSVAILQYLVMKHGGLGETPEENVIIDVSVTLSKTHL